MAADENKTLVSSKELASLFGLSDRRIQQLTADGTLVPEIVTADGHSVRRYDLLPAVHAYVVSLQEKLKKGSHSEKDAELRQQKMEAEIALKDSQAELHRVKLDIAAGKYIEREEVELDYQKFFVSFKRFALNIPTRLISMLSDQVKPTEARRAEQELTEEVKRMLRAFVVSGIPVPENTEPEPVKRKRTGAKTRTAQTT